MFLVKLPSFLPEFLKKKMLNELFQITADAFQSELPELKGLSFAQRLQSYAMFSKEQAESFLQSGRQTEELRRRLYYNAFNLGRKLRKRFNVITQEGGTTTLMAIYKFIGIDSQSVKQGEIIITDCYFSKYYSGEVCRLISSLDDGLAAGLSGGEGLYFTQRITEGFSCCKGYFERRVLD